ADADARVVTSLDLLIAFSVGPTSTWHTVDLLPRLGEIRCPTLVLAGEDDPISPIEDAADLVAALPQSLVRFESFPRCGHGVWRDDPDRAFAVLREFLST